MFDNAANQGILAKDLTVSYRNRLAIDRISFHVAPGEFVCFLGTTGCGKSTILNAIAGFIKPTNGAIYIDNHPIDGPGPDRGFVFQQHALFSWKTVQGNVEFGLKMQGMSRNERRIVANDYIKRVGLDGFQKNYPSQLSGGMQQRVGLARVLASNPAVMLMDEPFGSLDAQTRSMMQELLLDIWEEFGKTIIFVTHDVEEAIFLADRILVLTARPGVVKEEIRISLPRPRSYETLISSEYLQIKKRVLELIRIETLKTVESSVHRRLPPKNTTLPS